MGHGLTFFQTRLSLIFLSILIPVAGCLIVLTAPASAKENQLSPTAQKTVEIISGAGSTDSTETPEVAEQEPAAPTTEPEVQPSTNSDESLPTTGPKETAVAVVAIIGLGLVAKHFLRSRFMLRSAALNAS